MGNFETLRRRKDSKLIHVSLTVSPILDAGGKFIGVSSIAHDITRRKQAEETLKISEESFRILAEKSPDAILILNLESKIEYLNPAGEKLLDRPIEELLGSSFVYPETLGRPAELTIFRQNGEQRIAEVSASETIWQGNLAYLIALRDITESVQLREELRNLSLTDELTGLSNRRGFMILVQQQIKLAERHKRTLLLLYADLDDFKQINDESGHLAGDLALIKTADILKNTFRKSDIIARMGGDEFAVLLIESSNESAELVANHLKKQLELYNSARGQNRSPISFSFGIVSYQPESPLSLEELIAQADALMYEAKRQKKDANQIQTEA